MQEAALKPGVLGRRTYKDKAAQVYYLGNFSDCALGYEGVQLKKLKELQRGELGVVKLLEAVGLEASPSTDASTEDSLFTDSSSEDSVPSQYILKVVSLNEGSWSRAVATEIAIAKKLDRFVAFHRVDYERDYQQHELATKCAKHPAKTKYQNMHDFKDILILKSVPGMDLWEFAERYGNDTILEEELIIAIAILQAIKDLHGLNILHRDIKPENLVIDTGGAVPVVQLIDFQLSAICPVFSEDSSSSTSTDLWSSSDEQDGLSIINTILVGTRGYLAPELLSSQYFRIYNEATEVYAFGQTILSSLLKVMPYVWDCLRPQPGARPTIDQLIARLVSVLLAEQVDDEPVQPQVNEPQPIDPLTVNDPRRNYSAIFAHERSYVPTFAVERRRTRSSVSAVAPQQRLHNFERTKLATGF